MARFYVGSKFENKEAVRYVQRKLQELGHVITHDWTWESAEGKKEPELTQYMKDCAVKDYNGVVTCDVLFHINYKGCAGSFTEFGIALALGKVIVVVDAKKEGTAHNIFFYMPGINHFHNVDEAIRFVHKWSIDHQSQLKAG
jgi:hypothetical protein